MPYKPLENITLADAAFEVIGKDLNELFADSAIATFATMADLNSVGQVEAREINLENKELDKLLHDWISELIYLKDADKLIFSKFDVNIDKKNDEYTLKATVHGETINEAKHKLGIDVKAITWHELKVEHFQKGWKAVFVLDV